MEKKIRLLVLVLGVQLILALWLGKSGLNLERHPGTGPLIQFEKDNIRKIAIEGPEDTQVVLKKEGSNWLLPALNNFSADSQQVNQLLERIALLKTDVPTTTSQGAIERFRVAENNYERRISLSGSGDKTIATFYLGDSPRVRHSYARLANETEIYNVQLAPYDVSEKLSDWLDKTRLTLKKDDISSLTVADIMLERIRNQESQEDKDIARPEQEWTSKTTLQADESLNFAALDQLLDVLGSLRYDDVLGQKADASYGLENPLVTLDITYGKNKSRSYQLGKMTDADQYVIKVSDQPDYFQLSDFAGKELLDAAQKDQLISTPEQAAADKAAESDLPETDLAPLPVADLPVSAAGSKQVNGVLYPADAEIPQQDDSEITEASEPETALAGESADQPYTGHQVDYAEAETDSPSTDTRLINGVIYPADAIIPEPIEVDTEFAIPMADVPSSPSSEQDQPYSGHEVIYAEDWPQGAGDTQSADDYGQVQYPE